MSNTGLPQPPAMIAVQTAQTPAAGIQQGEPETEPAADQAVTVECVGCLVVSAPAWFERADFEAWRQSEGAPASWRGVQDVFMTFDTPFDQNEWEWEGSDSEGLPEDIYAAIGQMLWDQGYRYPAHGIIWIKPV